MSGFTLADVQEHHQAWAAFLHIPEPLIHHDPEPGLAGTSSAWDYALDRARRDPWLGRDVLYLEPATGLVRVAEVADGKPGDGGNGEDHEPDEPDPNGV